MDAQQPSEQRWQQIQTILDKVFDLPTAERLPSLQRACEGDPVLYQEVATLLKAEADAPGFLERPALELAESLIATATNSHHAPLLDYADRCVGAYRLREEIGRGGMGVVYRAERVDGSFDQQVAIKLLWNWQDREMRLDRFQREQQLLASLNHPNIALLFDGGLTEEGQPYIVMEYVQGEPINHYCDHHQLTIDARLRLTLQVVDALRYAHRNLVIHRDIKPSNILVTADGQIKLLDFGIAKLVDDQVEPEGPPAIDLTQTGEHLMTPGFAAPEQLLGQKVTVATDIFQLGLVLYELLTGCQAFREQAGSFYELARNICERTPTRPSVVMSHSTENGAGAARNNNLNDPPGALGRLSGSRLTQWRKKLNGDLDAIVLKALRNEPEKRYASMEAFGSDIQAYFKARPVAAHEKGARYRLGKFVRRNTFAVIAGFTIGALLITYAATVTVQANRIQIALQQSRVEARKAQQVSDFIIDIFKVSDPEVSGIETVTARNLLDRSRKKVQVQLAKVPELKAEMLHVLGGIYYNLGSYKESVSLLEQALVLRRELHPVQNLQLAASITQLAIAYNATDQFDKARLLFEESLSIHRRFGAGSAEQAEVLNALAQLLKVQHRYEEAEPLFHKAIAMLRRLTQNSDHRELAVALNNVAMLHRIRGNLSKAEASMREAIAMKERMFGDDHPEVTLSLRNLAGILTDMERYDEAQTLNLRTLKTQQRVLGRKHPYVAYTLQNLGVLASRRGQLMAAEEYLRKTLSIQKSVHGEDSAAVADTFNSLGTVLQERGEYAEAQSLYENMQRINRKVFEPDNPIIGRDFYRLASLSHATGKYQLARKQYEQALTILPPSEFVASSVNLGYARLLLDRGEPKRAEQSARKALDLRESRLPTGHSFTAEAQVTLGVILATQGRYNEARELLDPAYRVLKNRGRSGDIFYDRARETLEQLKGARGEQLSLYSD